MYRVVKRDGKVVDFDLSKISDAITKAFDACKKDYHPDVIMHNAAWTAVDKAEEMPDKVYAVNALGPRNIARAAKEVGAKMAKTLA